MKKRMMSLALLCMLLLTGCGGKYDDYETVTSSPDVSYKELVKDHLYYIPHRTGKADLAPRYQMFITKFGGTHEVISVESDTNEKTNNTTSGYFIFVRKK